MIDCGIQFPDVSYPGVELFSPDFGYVLDRKRKLAGLVITHGHEDHIGAIPYLAQDIPLKIFATRFPKGLISQKIAEFSNLKPIEFQEIKPNRSFKVGPFEVEPMSVQHSIIEALGLGIKTPVGNIIHSGDFKHDPKPWRGKKIGFEHFAAWGKRGVSLLFSDSTNAEKSGHSLAEGDITGAFQKLFKEQKGRLIIALFASNVRRVENLFHLAKKQHKKVALVGRSMHSYVRLAHEQGSINIPENLLIAAEDTHRYSDDRIIILSTGSQAEPKSALVRIAQEVYRDVQIKPEDHVILSSRFIPGNERAINSMINDIARLGALVTYQDLTPIHVSGHGFEEELLMMLRAVKPKFFVPVHGEFRHLTKHSKLAEKAGVKKKNIAVIEDGQVLELDKNSLTYAENLELERTPIVRGVSLQSDHNVFAQRHGMAKAGIVFALLIRDKMSKHLTATPRLTTYGLLYQRGEDPNEVLREAADDLAEAYETHRDREDLEELVRTELRRFLKHRLSHKPITIPLILDA